MKYMWILFALLAAVTAAMVTTLSKAGLKDADPNLAFAVQAVLIIVVAWTVVLVRGDVKQLADFDRKTWIYLVSAGVLTCLSSLFTFQALKIGDASLVNPLERTSLVFAVILAAIFLKEKITPAIVIGGLLIVAGAVVIAISKKT